MNIQDVENLAKLARIELGEEEKKEILSDMESILGYIKQIEEVKVDEVNGDHKVYNAWREDAVEDRKFNDKLVTSQFPDAQDGFLKVKKIL
jgi:aspartyl-tRNA(Asn)/glutamyl-tRNA(Gln) amidotransferase subunit C